MFRHNGYIKHKLLYNSVLELKPLVKPTVMCSTNALHVLIALLTSYTPMWIHK